jgi:hypothetical protein
VGIARVAQPLVFHPMTAATFRHLGMAPSLGRLNRERRRMHPVFVLELEKECHTHDPRAGTS